MSVTFVAVCVATSIAFAPQLFNDAVFPWDFLGGASTAPPFVAESIGEGRWPTWSNFVGSGQSLPLDPQSGLYYPLWWVLGLLDIPLSVTFLAKIHVAHVAVGAMGVALLARARKVPAAYLPLVAVAFVMFGGFYSQAQHVTHFRGFALFPWLLWSLTIPERGLPTRRLVWLPLVAWLAVASIYPGQLPAFAILGGAYLVTEFVPRRQRFRTENVRTVVVAMLASVGIAATMLIPYLAATSDPDLIFRPFPPTVGNLEVGSLHARDLFGLMVSSWGFAADGSIHSLYVGVIVLLGLSGLTGPVLRRQLPLVVTALVALGFASMGSVDFIAEQMLRVDLVFASRFPVADYKIGLVVPMLIFSAFGWSALIRRDVPIVRPLWVAAILLTAVWVARDVAITDPARRWPWLLLVLALGVAIAVWAPRRELVAVACLVVLVGYDGVRAHADLYFTEGQYSPWVAYFDDASLDRWSNAAHNLENALRVEPEIRPARIPPVQPIEDKPNGRPPDSFGFLATDYYVSSYTANVPYARLEAQTDPVLYEYLRQPWTAWVEPCAGANCLSADGELPAVREWGDPSPLVRTTRYGIDSIDYVVDTPERVLFIENELNYPGWGSTSDKVSPVDHDGAFRAWILEPGSYSFTARYRDEALDEQIAAFVVTIALLVALGGSMVFERRRDTVDA